MNWRTSGPLSALAVLGAVFAGAPAHAQDFDPRADEYRAACGACHGADGKGGAFIGAAKETPDLTRLAANNDGVFPTLEVFQIVDGRTRVGSHGDRMMPVWGDRFKVQAGDRYGAYGSEAVVRGRILEIVYYLESIQE